MHENEEASPWRGPSASLIPDEEEKNEQPPWGGHVLALPGLLVVLTVADTVLCAIALDRFKEVYAQYFNQGTAFVYCITSSLILLCRSREEEQPEQNGESMSRAPWYMLVFIGLFNGSSNWCLAVFLIIDCEAVSHLPLPVQ